MKPENFYQRFGTILKREALSNAFENAANDFLILKSSDPFPGFYCLEKNPADFSCKEISYYLPLYTNVCYSEDSLYRICLDINNTLDITVCLAKISFNGKYAMAIKLKGTDIDGIRKVVSAFEQNDLKFYKSRKVNTYLAMIYLKSFFDLREISGSIYQNSSISELFYFELPEKLDWKLFEKIITYQKAHTSFKNYDAALGWWITKPAYIDFIRIYGKKLSNSKLQTIRDEFITNFTDFKENNILI